MTGYDVLCDPVLFPHPKLSNYELISPDLGLIIYSVLDSLLLVQMIYFVP